MSWSAEINPHETIKKVNFETDSGIPCKREVHSCTTRDNHTLIMQRCLASPTAKTDKKPLHRHSVILCHGFASNRFTFDLNPDVSVPDYLARKGWDTWLVELRGSGNNKNTGDNACKTKCDAGETHFTHQHEEHESVHFDDHVEDCRAMIEYISRITRKPVHFIGHSMGAMLLQCCAGGESGQLGLIQSGVSIAGSLQMPESAWKNVRWMLPLIIPFQTIHPEHIQKVLAPMSFRIDSPWDELFFHQKNVKNEVARDMFRKNWEPISTTLINQLQTCFNVTGVVTKDNKAYISSLSSINFSMLLIAGSVDEQCPASCMEKISPFIHGSTYKLIGKQSGHKEDYGHFDLIVGHNAKSDVWDMVCRFLERNE